MIVWAKDGLFEVYYMFDSRVLPELFCWKFCRFYVGSYLNCSLTVIISNGFGESLLIITL